jgi:V-type H+-transporting ATPase subunit a
MKMKIAVIMGVLQMIFGIVLRGMNNIYFNNYLDFFCEFLPMMIFMTGLFGYMILMIFIKWSIDWTGHSSQAPSIITQLMNIFLKGGSVDGKPLWGTVETQESFHRILFIIALICIPVLLFPKPIVLYLQSKNKPQGYHSIHDEDEQHVHEQGKGHGAGHGDHDGFANLFIHQSIETIEFTLGCVSNTASYLRLWALSLAHAQLAKVFFDKALLGFIQGGNLFLVILGFFIFANITFAVLMCMDLMECFLHTLRLHWVEFQNKFYKADGYAFVPFSFKTIVESN